MSAPEAEVGPISRLSTQLLRGPLQCPRVVHTDLSWQLSRLLCARGAWPPAAGPRSGVTSSRRDLFSGSFVHIGSRTALPPPRWRRGRDSWISQLQRLQGIDQAGPEIVIARTAPEPLCARRQNAANIGRREFRIAFQQHRHYTAYLVSCDRRY